MQSKGKGKNVLYISYDGMTDSLGQSQVIPYLIELSKKGYQFTILSAEKPVRFKQHKAYIEELLQKSGIRWFPILYTKSPPVASTIYDYQKLKRKADYLHKLQPFDIVHSRSYISSLIGLWMKKKYSVKFIFDMRGFWADERVDGKLWNLNNPIYKSVYFFFKRKEKEFLQCADYTVSLTKVAKDEIHRWKHISGNPIKIKVIPCCVDTSLFDPAMITETRRQKLKSELQIEKDNFILSYLGSIGTWYMLDEMLDFFIELRKKIPLAKFLFITHDKHEKIIEVAEKKGIDRKYVLLQSAKRNEVPALLSLSDYSIFFILPAYSKMSSSPTKQGEIMAMGVPAICNEGIGDTDRIIKECNAGILVKDFKYEQAINELIKPLSKDSHQLRLNAINYFSLSKGVELYEQIYQSLA